MQWPIRTAYLYMFMKYVCSDKTPQVTKLRSQPTHHHHHQFIWIKPNTNAKAM